MNILCTMKKVRACFTAYKQLKDFLSVTFYTDNTKGVNRNKLGNKELVKDTPITINFAARVMLQRKVLKEIVISI